MKFSTSKKELQEALQKLSKATPTRTTLPILSCVLINATNKKTTFRTTDLEITIDLEISVSIEEEGSAAVPLKQLFENHNVLHIVFGTLYNHLLTFYILNIYT